MSDSEDEFDLTPNVDEPLNAFQVVHLLNRSDTYHLTRQVLLDSVLTQNSYCFFCHILNKSVNDFNETYGSFACLIQRNNIEADLYLNVNSGALEHIIRYIQTGKISTENICIGNYEDLTEIINLATMFGMPKLVNILRHCHFATEDNYLSLIKEIVSAIIIFYKNCVDTNLDDKYCLDLVNNFLEDNKQDLRDKSQFSKIWIKAVKMFSVFLSKQISITSAGSSSISASNSSTSTSSTFTQEMPCVLSYYSLPHCKLCTDFKPSWEKISERLKNLQWLSTEEIDCFKSENHDRLIRFNINKFPTLILKKGSKYITYEGEMTTSAIANFIVVELIKQPMETTKETTKETIPQIMAFDYTDPDWNCFVSSEQKNDPSEQKNDPSKVTSLSESDGDNSDQCKNNFFTHYGKNFMQKIKFYDEWMNSFDVVMNQLEERIKEQNENKDLTGNISFSDMDDSSSDEDTYSD
jgi:hypothetical protein